MKKIRIIHIFALYLKEIPHILENKNVVALYQGNFLSITLTILVSLVVEHL